MSSKPGRPPYADWNWLFKGVIWVYRNKGYRGKVLAEKFRQHFSKETIEHFNGVPTNDNMIAQRGDKGVRLKNAFEHPDKHPIGKLFIPEAQDIVDKQYKLSKEDVEHLLKRIGGEHSEDLPVIEAPIKAIGQGEGYLYVMSNSSNGCAIGKTTNKDPEERIKAHRKGDIDCKISYQSIFCENVHSLEKELKIKFKSLHMGSERYDISADEMLRHVRKTADALGIMHRLIVP